MTYRDDLEAAHARVRSLELRVSELEHELAAARGAATGPRAPPEADSGARAEPDAATGSPDGWPPPSSRAGKPRRRRSSGRGGLGLAVGPLAKSVLGLVALIALFGAGFPACVRGCGSCAGYQDAAMLHLESCPRARELLGEGIHVRPFGWACDLNEHLTLPVAGAKASGSYDFHRPHRERGDQLWHVFGAALSVGREEVNIDRCVNAATGSVGDDADALGGRCDAGDAVACLALGAMLEQGARVQASPERARARYEQACRGGVKAACALRDAGALPR
jgi:hypothetical protein